MKLLQGIIGKFLMAKTMHFLFLAAEQGEIHLPLLDPNPKYQPHFHGHSPPFEKDAH